MGLSRRALRVIQSSQKITAAAFLPDSVASQNDFKVSWPFAILKDACMSSFRFGVVISSMALCRSTTRAELQLVLPEERVMLERPALRFRGSASFCFLRKKLVEGKAVHCAMPIERDQFMAVCERDVLADISPAVVFNVESAMQAARQFP